MGLKERLLRRSRIGPMERSTTAHAPHAKHLDLLMLAIQLRDRFVPVNLRLLTPGVALRHERLLSDETHRALALSDIPSHGRFSNRMFRKLAPNPFLDPVTRVPLFPRRLPVRLQHLVDKSHHRLQPRLLPLRALPRRGHRVTQCLTIRRCTPSFRDTPWIVPTPNSCSRRISSNNFTFDLLDTRSLRSNFMFGTDSPGQLPGVDQIK